MRKRTVATARKIDNRFFANELARGKLAVCQELICQYLPRERVPKSLTKCKAMVKSRIHVDIFAHQRNKGLLLSRNEIQEVKRKRPYPLKCAKQSEVLRLLLQ